MSTYAEIKAQIAELESKAQQARIVELDAAKAQIAEIMKAYQLTLDDITSSARSKAPSKVRHPVAIKYRDSASGETWTGRGRAPRWLAGKNKEDYLVK